MPSFFQFLMDDLMGNTKKQSSAKSSTRSKKSTKNNRTQAKSPTKSARTTHSTKELKRGRR